MKPEYKEMLEKVIEWLTITYGLYPEVEEEWPISEEEDKRRGDMFCELIESGDMEVLRGLMGVLTMKAETGMGALNEYFPGQIFHYYTDEQIADAVFEKFDAIYDNHCALGDTYGVADILERICSELLPLYGECKKDDRNFQRFREKFNQLRPRHAEIFLNRIEANYSDEDNKLIIETLREDMNKWGDGSRIIKAEEYMQRYNAAVEARAAKEHEEGREPPEFIAKQTELLKQGKIREAIEMGVEDLLRIDPRYNEGIQLAIKSAEEAWGKK
jgi:hypothetical protein